MKSSLSLFAAYKATDADVGSNAAIDFSLAVGTAESEIFAVQSTASTVALILLQPLDREITDSYSLVLQATDRGSPSLVGETTINITVLVRLDTHSIHLENRGVRLNPI